MQVRNVRVVDGKFDSVPVTGDRGHRTTKVDITVGWEWRPDGSAPWRQERLHIPAGERWDGASRPDFIGWLIPRWGVFSLASLVHDYCFGDRPYLSDGMRISRQHTDVLYLAAMEALAAERVSGERKARSQVAIANVMYRAVRWFGEWTWNKHDDEFRT